MRGTFARLEFRTLFIFVVFIFFFFRVGVTFVDRAGKEVPVKGKVGTRLLTVSWENKIDAGGDCGGNMECGSCRVVVDPAFRGKLPPQSPIEKELLATLGPDVEEG